MGGSPEGQQQHLPGPLSGQQVLQTSQLDQTDIHPAAATAGTAALTSGRCSHVATQLTWTVFACTCYTEDCLLFVTGACIYAVYANTPPVPATAAATEVALEAASCCHISCWALSHKVSPSTMPGFTPASNADQE